MSYITPVPRQSVTDPALARNLNAVEKQLGVLPNMFGVFAHTPVALNAYLQLAGAAGSGRLDARQRELLALAVASANACEYCTAAHAAIGSKVGLQPAQIDQARQARAADPRTQALLVLAQRIVATRGHVPIAELDAFKAAGFDDAAILEVLVNVVLNIYTNYTNHIARTEVDFPRPAALAAA